MALMSIVQLVFSDGYITYLNVSDAVDDDEIEYLQSVGAKRIISILLEIEIEIWY